MKNTKLYLGTTVKELKNELEKVHVVLSDGSKETFDLVVASDGIHSEIREEFFGHKQVSFYDWSLRFFWVPAHIPVPKGALCLSKEGCNFALYPTFGKCCVGIYEYNPKHISHPPLAVDGFLPYLKRHGWTAEHLKDLAKEAKEGHQYYDHLRHVAVDKWYKKRLVLLGDARHGLSPITGMGASMALEDGFVLADELAKVTPDNINMALEQYSKRRDFRIKNVVSLSKFVEKFYFIKSPLGRLMRDFVANLLPEKFLLNKLRKVLEEKI
ncbi:FAD-dependent monooxygenase [Candidatus Nomurabacteria bacterium]|nr:FAD-dependent monooxygenase [Candidatus Nomurabacteria bacterium]